MALRSAVTAARERFVSLFQHMPGGLQDADDFAAGTCQKLSPITADGNGSGRV